MPTFFDLPRELRDEIYHQVWLNTPIIKLCFGECCWSAWYDRSVSFNWPLSAPGLLLWLRSNKDFLAEGVAAFHRKGVLALHENLTKRVGVAAFHRQDVLALHENTSLKHDIFKQFTILSPLTARQLHFVPEI